MGTMIPALTLPATDGTGTLTYTLTGPNGVGPLPTGLTFNATVTARPLTSTLTGTPMTAGMTRLTYTATDANGGMGGTARVTFDVTVAAQVTLPAQTAPRPYTQGAAITPLTLPDGHRRHRPYHLHPDRAGQWALAGWPDF